MDSPNIRENNANNFFNNRTGIKQSAYRFSNTGGNLGGPLNIPGVHGVKGKLFFFLSSEEIRELRPKAPQTVTVPTAAERQGDFSANKIASLKDPLGGVFPNKIVPANRIVAAMQKYLNLLPQANFVLAEHLRGQFRVEAYNILNHTNFSSVDTAAKFNAAGQQTNTTLGQYTAAVFPRRMQLAVRLTF